MPRPKLHSDEAILTAARQVLLSKGPAQFTLTDVARAVGISRAALIHRFKDRDTLHRGVMEGMTQEVRDYFARAPRERGLAPMWEMLRDLIDGMGSGEGFSGYLLLEFSNVTDPELNALTRERSHLVRTAIAERLPPGPHDPARTARTVQNVIHGAFMQWLVEQDGPLNDFTVDETRAVLQVLYPEHHFA